MSYLGSPLPGFEKTEEEQEDSLNKALGTIKGVTKALLPDITDPKETAEYFLDLASDIKLAKNPVTGTGLFAGKRLLADLPVVRRAVDAGKEIVEPIVKKTRTFLETDYLEPIYAGIEDVSGGLLSRASKVDQPVGKNVFAYGSVKELPPYISRRHVARKFFDDTPFIDTLTARTKEMDEYIVSHGNKIEGFSKSQTIVAPDGSVYRYKSTSEAGKPGKYSWKQEASAQQTVKNRLIGKSPDKDTLTNLFSKHVRKDKVESTVNLYTQTQKKIYKKLEKARTAYNKGKPKSQHMSIEHIFDVNFYKRLQKDLVPGFSGRGADEAMNLKMIPYLENARTGALAKKINIDDALIGAIKRGEFTDYNKSTAQFLYHDIGNVVKKWGDKEWKVFTDRMLTDPTRTAQEILVDIIRNSN